MIAPWYAKRQKSNSVAGITMTETAIPARPGFCAVVDALNVRGAGSASANNVNANMTDGANSSFVCAGSAPTINTQALAQGVFRGPHRFGEGLAVQITVNGNNDATTVGYTLDYHYEPVFLGFIG